jgi:uncharacterized membrane protein
MDQSGDSTSPQARGVAAERGVSWLTEAWPVFREQAGLWVLITVIAIGVTLVCGIVPLLGNLLSPFVSTLVLGGMLLVARKQRAGGSPEVGDLFAILSHPALVRLMIVTLIYVGLSIAAGLVVAVVFGMGGGMAAITGGLVGGDDAAAALVGGTMAIALLVFVAVLVPIIAMYWFAVPLVLFRDAEPWPAMTTSLRAVLANIVPMLVYGVVSLVLVILACIPLMLGLLVAIPLLATSLLISFDDIFGTAQAKPPLPGIEKI